MTITDVPNHKQIIITRWLHGEYSSEGLAYQIFLEYNPDYPNKIERYIKL